MPYTWEKYLARFTMLGPDDCWPWMERSRDKNGYGLLSWREGGRHYTRRAHRWGWEQRYGPIPPGMVICHSCDLPPCQNPTHWFLGTNADNHQDMTAKGRARARRGGQTHHKAVLTDEQVTEIRARATGERGEASRLAREYGVSRRSISHILSGNRRNRTNQ